MHDFYQCSAEQQAKRIERLARAALKAWGIDPNVRLGLIKHQENTVFSVTDGDQRYALRVHRAGYHTDAELLSELQWIAALNSDELRTPQVIPARDGALFVHAEAEGVPESRQVDLLEWFDGLPLGSDKDGLVNTEGVADTFLVVGRLMAITHNHSSSWTPPPGFVRHAWDEEGMLGDEPVWGRYWELAALDDEKRARLTKAKSKALEELASFGKGPDRYGLIHADFGQENLLRNDSGICLIDFDDSGYGWHMYDVATTLVFFQGEEFFAEARDALVTGYRDKRELPDEHLAHLPLFFLLRGFTGLSWAHTRADTEKAQELTPSFVALVDEMAKHYLAGKESR